MKRKLFAAIIILFLVNNHLTAFSLNREAPLRQISPGDTTKTYSTGGTLTVYEYWFDDHYATRVTGSSSSGNPFTLNMGLPTPGLAIGLHCFHLRFKDLTGPWSSVVSQYFFKQPQLPAASGELIAWEYWFDNEYGSKVYQTMAPTEIHQLITGLPVNSLAEGLHTFHLRYKANTGNWSSTFSQFFYKPHPSELVERQIADYEYWFDNDYGAKVTQSVTHQQTFILNTTLSAALLVPGLHNFHIRFKKDSGPWSSVVTAFIFKIGVAPSSTSLISGYRYWFDLDNSAMINHTLPAPVNPDQLVQNIYAGKLTVGDHSIHFQFKDTDGRWSSVVSAPFTFTGPSEQTVISTQTISNGQAYCYDALKTITVAGNGATFIIETGGSTDMIAGQNIIYFPSTTVQSGGYLHGKILPGGPFCVTPALPAVVKEEMELQQPIVSEKTTVRIYPNPTPDKFTIEFSVDPVNAPAVVKIFNLMGSPIWESMIHSGRLHEFSLMGQCPGVYLVKILQNHEIIVEKIIRQ